MVVGGQRHAPDALPLGNTQYPSYRRLGGPQGRSGRVRKISSPTGFRSPDRSARSELLYRLSYPGPKCVITLIIPVVIWSNGIVTKDLKENLEAIIVAGCLHCCVFSAAVGKVVMFARIVSNVLFYVLENIRDI
jgi:hypothetical protein